MAQNVFVLNRVSLDPDGYFNVTDFIAASLDKGKLLPLVTGKLVDLSLGECLRNKVKCIYSIDEYYELSKITLI